jgi:hypothetical protein
MQQEIARCDHRILLLAATVVNHIGRTRAPWNLDPEMNVKPTLIDFTLVEYHFPSSSVILLSFTTLNLFALAHKISHQQHHYQEATRPSAVRSDDRRTSISRTTIAFQARAARTGIEPKRTGDPAQAQAQPKASSDHSSHQRRWTFRSLPLSNKNRSHRCSQRSSQVTF